MKSKLYRRMEHEYDCTIILTKTATQIIDILYDILGHGYANIIPDDLLKQATDIKKYHTECKALTATHKIDRYSDVK